MFVDKTDKKCLTQFVFTISQASFFSLIQYIRLPHMPRTIATPFCFLRQTLTWPQNVTVVSQYSFEPFRLVIACLKQKNSNVNGYAARQDNPLHYTQTHYTVNDRTVFPHLPASSFSQVLHHILQANKNTRCKPSFVLIKVCCKWSKSTHHFKMTIV